MRVLPSKWRQKPAGIDVERNYVTATLCIHGRSNLFCIRISLYFWHFVLYDRLYVHRQSFDDSVPKRLCEVCMILLRFSSVSDVPYVRLEEIKPICF